LAARNRTVRTRRAADADSPRKLLPHLDRRGGIATGTVQVFVTLLLWWLLACLDKFARFVLFGLVKPIAQAYVRLESLAFRLRLSHISVADIRISSKPPIVSPRERNLPGSPILFDPLSNGIRLVIGIPLATIASVTYAAFQVVRGALRLRWRNLAALALALWYSSSFAPILEMLGLIRLGDIQLSVIVASGTLFAVGYAAANSDVRGRAELNKTASLACRTTLHGCTNSLLTGATGLANIRVVGQTRLAQFPTKEELRSLTGRDDLTWLWTTLLPVKANPLPPALSKIINLNDAQVKAIAAARREPPSGADSSVNLADAQQMMTQIADARTTIERKLGDLKDTGFAGKVDRVLGASALGALIGVSHADFGAEPADVIVESLSTEWLHAAVPDSKERDELKATWVALARREPDDAELRQACRSLSRLLRRFAREEHTRFWYAVLTEVRLRHVAETIDRSLRPRFVERIRQAFGK
jgi:hypothetical protein